MSRLRFTLPRTRTTRQAWLWALAALLVLKAAVPLFAAVAAAHRGVSLAQVCTVYGVRTVAAMPADHLQSDPHGDTLPDHGGAGEHCMLASLAGGPLPGVLPAVPEHAPVQAPLATPAVFDALPADATLRWLSAQLHAPPVRG